MMDLNRCVYRRLIAPVSKSNEGEIIAVAVTKERNAYVVWYGFAEPADATIDWQPISGGETAKAIHFGQDAREEALELAVDRAVRAKKLWNKTHKRDADG